MGKSGPLSQWVKVGQFCPQCLSGPLLPNDCLKDQRSQVPSLYCQSLRVSVSQFRRGDRPPGLCVYVALFYLPTGSKINGLKSHHYSLRVSVYQFRRGDISKYHTIDRIFKFISVYLRCLTIDRISKYHTIARIFEFS